MIFVLALLGGWGTHSTCVYVHDALLSSVCVCVCQCFKLILIKELSVYIVDLKLISLDAVYCQQGCRQDSYMGVSRHMHA